MDVDNGPIGLKLDTMVTLPRIRCAYWNCLNYGLAMVLQSNTQVQIYHYVERDSQPKQAPMCYVMMLSQLVANIDYIWLSLFPTE